VDLEIPVHPVLVHQKLRNLPLGIPPLGLNQHLGLLLEELVFLRAITRLATLASATLASIIRVLVIQGRRILEVLEVSEEEALVDLVLEVLEVLEALEALEVLDSKAMLEVLVDLVVVVVDLKVTLDGDPGSELHLSPEGVSLRPDFLKLGDNRT